MSKIRDTCIQYAEAGDQHVGRVVAGLPVLSAKYACSSPIFCIGTNERECSAEDIDNVIATLFPNFEKKINLKPILIA